MMLDKMLDRHKSVIRTFRFVSNNHAHTNLSVTVEYLSPRALQEQQEQGRERILSQRTSNALQDVPETNRIINAYYNELLASRVKRIDGLTIQKLKELVPLDPELVKKAGGLEAVVHSDTLDQTAISADDRQKWEYPDRVGTYGQVAADNIKQLVAANGDFQNFLHQTIPDVSLFQDEKFDEELKNSSAGSGPAAS